MLPSCQSRCPGAATEKSTLELWGPLEASDDIHVTYPETRGYPSTQGELQGVGPGNLELAVLKRRLLSKNQRSVFLRDMKLPHSE